MCVIRVEDDQVFHTEVAVLDFLGARRHNGEPYRHFQQGGLHISDGRFVWFPVLDGSHHDGWRNVVSNDGMHIVEYAYRNANKLDNIWRRRNQDFDSWTRGMQDYDGHGCPLPPKSVVFEHFVNALEETVYMYRGTFEMEGHEENVQDEKGNACCLTRWKRIATEAPVIQRQDGGRP